MRLKIAVLAALAALVVGCGLDNGKAFIVEKHFTGPFSTIDIERFTEGRSNEFLHIAAMKYALDVMKRIIVVDCPCYYVDDTDPRLAVAAVKEGKVVIELLPDAEYGVYLKDEKGKKRNYRLPRE